MYVCLKVYIYKYIHIYMQYYNFCRAYDKECSDELFRPPMSPIRRSCHDLEDRDLVFLRAGSQSEVAKSTIEK